MILVDSIYVGFFAKSGDGVMVCRPFFSLPEIKQIILVNKVMIENEPKDSGEMNQAPCVSPSSW